MSKFSRLLLLSLLIVFYSLTLSAQVTFGVKGGLNLADINSNLFEHKVCIGYNTGVLMKINLNDKFFLQSEIIYSLKGWKSSQVPQGTTYANFNYLNIPVLFGFSPFKKLSIISGPEFGYLLNANFSSSIGSNNLTSSFENVDLGISLGTSYSLTRNIGVEIRYTHRLKKIFNLTRTDIDGVIVSNTSKTTNRVFQIGVFYLFGKE